MSHYCGHGSWGLVRGGSLDEITRKLLTESRDKVYGSVDGRSNDLTFLPTTPTVFSTVTLVQFQWRAKKKSRGTDLSVPAGSW